MFRICCLNESDVQTNNSSFALEHNELKKKKGHESKNESVKQDSLL